MAYNDNNKITGWYAVTFENSTPAGRAAPGVPVTQIVLDLTKREARRSGVKEQAGLQFFTENKKNTWFLMFFVPSAGNLRA